MKLLFCDQCGDAFSLPMHTPRSCRCGLVVGRYINRQYAETNGEGMCLAIDNGDLRKALFSNHDKVIDIHCWFRPHEGELNPHTTVNYDLGWPEAVEEEAP